MALAFGSAPHFQVLAQGQGTMRQGGQRLRHRHFKSCATPLVCATRWCEGAPGVNPGFGMLIHSRKLCANAELIDGYLEDDFTIFVRKQGSNRALTQRS